MAATDIFEYATRNRLRFAGLRGTLTTEDLWDLPVKDLDLVFKGLKAELKTVSEESLLDIRSPADKVLQIKVDIVTSIVKTKLAETEARKSRDAKRAKKQELEALLAEKQNEELRGKSAEELKKLIDELTADD